MEEQKSEEFEKEFLLPPEDAAGFLRDVADSMEENDEAVVIEGDDWQAYQPVSGNIPLRINSGKSGLEIGFKIK